MRPPRKGGNPDLYLPEDERQNLASNVFAAVLAVGVVAILAFWWLFL